MPLIVSTEERLNGGNSQCSFHPPTPKNEGCMHGTTLLIQNRKSRAGIGARVVECLPSSKP
jgi:hypothetical protein